MPVYAEATLLGSFQWSATDPQFGGFSAIELSADGSGFVALTDRGSIARAAITRSGDAITDVNVTTLRRLLGPTRAPLADEFNDSEGLAIGPDERLYVSFEGQHGVRWFDSIDTPGSELSSAPAFVTMQPNASLEALAIGPDGTLYTMPERSGRATRPFPVFRFRAGVWDQPFEIARSGPYLISGADVGPDGRLYVLERDFSGFGFHTRVRRLDLDKATAETLLETGIGKHGNMEGISVWQHADGGLIMTLIADNNFRSILTNEIAEYRIDG